MSETAWDFPCKWDKVPGNPGGDCIDMYCGVEERCMANIGNSAVLSVVGEVADREPSTPGDLALAKLAVVGLRQKLPVPNDLAKEHL